VTKGAGYGAQHHTMIDQIPAEAGHWT